MPTSQYLTLTSSIEGTPTGGTVPLSGEYLGLLVSLEQRFWDECKVAPRP